MKYQLFVKISLMGIFTIALFCSNKSFYNGIKRGKFFFLLSHIKYEQAQMHITNYSLIKLALL